MEGTDTEKKVQADDTIEFYGKSKNCVILLLFF